MTFTIVMYAFPQNDVPLLYAIYANACQVSGTSHESKFLRFCRVSFEVCQVSRLIKSRELERSLPLQCSRTPQCVRGILDNLNELLLSYIQDQTEGVCIVARMV